MVQKYLSVFLQIAFVERRYMFVGIFPAEFAVFVFPKLMEREKLRGPGPHRAQEKRQSGGVFQRIIKAGNDRYAGQNFYVPGNGPL